MTKPLSSVNAVAWMFLIPALVLMALFAFWPVLFGSWLAFTRFNVVTPPEWVGLDNFRFLFSDPTFIQSLKNSLIYLLIVPCIQIASLALAVLVNDRLPGMKMFRAVYYIPVVTTVSVVGIMWSFMYHEYGLLNWVMQGLRLVDAPIGWLSDDSIALFSVMFVTFWRGLGWYMVMYLAGLQSIPSDLYEAAKLDGASRWQIFWRITVPMLKPTILLCSVVSLLAALKSFEEVQILTQGGPMSSTYTALYYAYEMGIAKAKFPRAMAASLIVSLICIALAWLNFRFIKPAHR